ncbi:DUF2764 family protein [Thermophagus sp. OGC60D27]|uniref:DUF2764 family protein n=1 Tax=Thermophagus sp. OGC60D27 TaxID=3458415 RepID=UPI004037A3F3
MNKNYYCLVAGLPDIVPDEKKLPFSSVQFRDQLKEELTQTDFELVQLFFLRFDHKNLLNLFFATTEQIDWDHRGNFSRQELEPLTDRKVLDMVDFSIFPEYLRNFIFLMHSEEAPKKKIDASRILSSGYYQLLEVSDNQFVREVSQFLKTRSNIITALNIRKHQLSATNLLIGEDEITDALKKSRVRDFGLSTEVEYIEDLLQIFENTNLREREMKLDMQTWEFIEDATFFNFFSIERILAFLLKLFIAERWTELDPQKGREMFDKIFTQLKSGFEFPEEYTLTYGKKR